jgi:hypothetical protein
MRNPFQTSRALGLMLCIISVASTLAADDLPLSTASKKTKTVELPKAAPIKFVPHAKNEKLDQHVSPFSGPLGPSLPLGTTLNAVQSHQQQLVIRVAASSTLTVLDLPPGARRRVAATN